MHMSTAIFLVNPAVRCVTVAYDKIMRGDKVIPTEEKSFKTLDADLKVDALVVVPTDTRWGFTVGKVTKVDVDVNHDSTEVMRWLAQPIDLTMYEHILAQESRMMAQVKAADDKARQAELAAKLRQHSPNFEGIALIEMGPIHAKSAYEPEPGGRGGAQQYPAAAPNETFRKAPRADRGLADDEPLF